MDLNLVSGFKSLSLVAIFLMSASCTNVFKNFANQTTDEALAFDARKAINNEDYDSALTLLGTMSADYRYSRNGVILATAAYAGKCGLNFSDFVSALSSSSGSDPFLLQMMKLWTSTTTDYTQCVLAQTEMERLASSYSSRSPDDAFFMVVLGMVKLGTLLHEKADTDDNGVVDSPPFTVGQPAFCNSANFSNSLTAEVGSGIGMVIANLTVAGSSIAGLDTTAIAAACDALAVGLGGVNPCLIEDRAVFLADNSKLKAIRSLLNTNSAGLINGTPCP